MPNIEPKPLRVAVGVVKNKNGEILISRRQKGQHLEGLWEFPGGKIEANESDFEALSRELKEEVGITILSSTKIMTIHHQYPTKTVQLEIMLADTFTGNAVGVEGQEVCWVALGDLHQYSFPEANKEILDYLLS